MADWRLGIDFGTSFTVAAVAVGNQVEVIDVESDGRSRLPSAVFLTEDGEILVGTRAQHQSVFAPERFEPTPKRSIGEGELFLGDRLVPVEELIAAVFRRVYRESCRQRGGVQPSAVVVTHPAAWADARLQVLRSATAAAGIEHADFVPEPVAAAARIATAATQSGQRVAVYDFGGGTFDAAVLLRRPTGFQVVGPPTGRDPLGGEDIDRRIIDHLGDLLADEYPDEWKQLINPPDVSWRRDAASLRAEVQQAKETLSEVSSCQLWVAGIDRGVQLTRTELNELIGADVEQTADALEEAITAAGVSAAELAGVYLVGGSSRIPLVVDTIWRRLGITPTAQDNPKSVVAQGAAAWLGEPMPNESLTPTNVPPPLPVLEPGRPTLNETAGRSVAPPPQRLASQANTPLVATKAPPLPWADRPFRLRLALSLGEETGSGQLAAIVTVNKRDSNRLLTIQGWPAPAGATTTALANQLVSQHAKTTAGYQEISRKPSTAFGWGDGMELRFAESGTEGRTVVVERCLAGGKISIVATTPEDLLEALDGIDLQHPTLPADDFFSLPLSITLPEGAIAHERVQFTGGPAGRQVTANHFVTPQGHSTSSWLEHQTDALLASTPRAQVVSREAAKVIEGHAGEIVILKVAGRHATLGTIGVTEIDGEIIEVSAWVPAKDVAALAWLANYPRIQPA